MLKVKYSKSNIIIALLIIFTLITTYLFINDITDKQNSCFDEQERNANHMISVVTDKEYYQLGENILINITVFNQDDVTFSDDLTIFILSLYSSGEQGCAYDSTIPITIPPESYFTFPVVLEKDDYTSNGMFSIYANISTTYNFSTKFFILGGLETNLTIPESIEKNEEFTVTLDVENILDVTLSNISITVSFSPHLSLIDGYTEILIPELLSGETTTTSWLLSSAEDGYQSIDIRVTSDSGDYVVINNGIKCDAKVIELTNDVKYNLAFTVNISSDSTFQIDEAATVDVFIENTRPYNVSVNFTFNMFEVDLSSGRSLRSVCTENQTVLLPANSVYTTTFSVSHSIYKYAGNYMVSAIVANETFLDFDQKMITINGSNLMISIPSNVTINEVFTVNFTIENVMNITLHDISVVGYFPYHADVENFDNHRINYTIPSLSAYETHSKMWNVTMPVSGEYLVSFHVFSNETGQCHKSENFEVIQ